MPVSEKKRRSNDAYNAKCDFIAVRPMLEDGAVIRETAKAAGQSLQGYILQAVRERMERDSANKYYIGIPKSAADQAGQKNNQTGKEWLIETVKKALED
jgi:hypothetical protein